jgi:hypothetical protein
MTTKTFKACSDFLKRNGWKMEYSSWSWVYHKDGHISVEFNTDDDMIFLGESGDFLHEKTNLYTLIGVLIYHRQLSIGFLQ